jgi:hypothetical protein
VQHAQRLSCRCRQVDQVAEPLHVVELQVPRVVEVDVRLRGAVHQQRPRAGPVGVADQLGGARLRAGPVGRTAPALLPVCHNVQYRATRPELALVRKEALWHAAGVGQPS